jgi:hypothetical protein
MPLPVGLLGSLTLWLFASGLIFMPWARVKQVAGINTKNLFHGHFLLIGENYQIYRNYKNDRAIKGMKRTFSIKTQGMISMG